MLLLLFIFKVRSLDRCMADCYHVSDMIETTFLFSFLFTQTIGIALAREVV